MILITLNLGKDLYLKGDTITISNVVISKDIEIDIEIDKDITKGIFINTDINIDVEINKSITNTIEFTPLEQEVNKL